MSVYYKRSDMIGRQRIMAIKDTTLTWKGIVYCQRQNDVTVSLLQIDVILID